MAVEERSGGWILIFVALSLVMLCGFVALAVDVGGFLSVRASAQRAADAAALAGALTFVTGCGKVSCDPKSDAEIHAVQTASTNQILGKAIPAGDVTAVADVGKKQVTVTVSHNAPIFFANVLGFGIPHISATAIAEASPYPVAADCAKPLFLPNTIHALNPCNECLSATPQVLVNGSGQLTAYGPTVIGSFYDINVKNANESLYPPPPGKVNLFATTFKNDTQNGTVQYGQNIFQCPAGARIACNGTFPVKSDPGLNSETLAQFTNLGNGNGTPDTFVQVGQYRGADGKISSTSHQLITVPIFDVCSIPNFCPAATLKDPTQQIKVVGYARMFSRVIGGKVRLYLVGLSGCGSLTPDPNITETGPYGIPVRLVHN